MSEYQSECYFKYHYMNKMRFWRVVAFLIFISACVVFGLFMTDKTDLNQTDYIAEIEIEGMIIHAGDMVEKIEQLKDDKAVKSVIVAINSPGGTTYDSEIIYNALRKIAKNKPVVSYMKNIAASGGYVVALAAERIFAAQTTITGSIGVLMQVPNAQKLMQNIGVSMTEIKSSPIKGEPNYFNAPPPEALKNIKAMVDDTHGWFKNIVKIRRPSIAADQFAMLTNGGVFSGQKAVHYKLVDAIGGQSEAKSYLVKKYKLQKDLKIKQVELTESDDFSLKEKIFKHLFSYFFPEIQNISFLPRNNVDGLLSLWHS